MELLHCFPPPLQEELSALDLSRASDIRLFAGKPCAVTCAEGEYVTRCAVGADALDGIAQALTRRMLRLSQAAGEGYITLRGGHRLGLCGQVITRDGQTALRGIGSLCIRLAHEAPGCGHVLAACARQGGVLAVGAPGSGKTTLLRDAVRILSNAGLAVGLADARSEVAACVDGVPQLDVGPRTHVVDGCEKAAGLRWLLRSMSPQVLATDELYGDGECRAVREAAACGVPVMATAHAGSAAELCRRRSIRGLLRDGTIAHVLFLQERRVLLTASAREVLEAACLFQ